MMRAAAVAFCVLAGLAAALSPAPARAEASGAGSLTRRTTGVELVDGRLAASVGLQDLFGPAERQRLTSGFATRVLIRVYLHREGGNDPIALGIQRAEIVYDIWDEKFRVRVTRGPGTDTEVALNTIEETVTRATLLQRFPVADMRLLEPGARYFLAFRADLNPISEELLADVRRWLLQPGRGQRRLGTGDTVFGSFVSIFVNPRIEDSERQVRFLSQTFIGPPR
ncbi:MAG TPA: hypothetical protein VMU50_10485 [Polyangia bacterium]|nr:hypothetical protein [Polyangia bacterium]